MKFTTERDSFVKALTDASRGVPTRPERASLSCLHLNLAGDTLVVTATDMNLWIRSQTTVADGGTPGEAIIAAKHFVEAVRSCDPGVIEVEATDEKTRLTAGSSRFEFNTLLAEEFPEMPAAKFSEATVDAASFLDALGRVVTARSTDDSRTVLTSVLLSPETFDSGGSGLRLVCTDSYRLALCDLEGFELKQLEKDLFIPGRTLEELHKHAGEAKEIVVGLSEEQIAFTIGEVYFLTKLIEGEYPKYQNLIPKQDDYPNKLMLSGGDDEQSPKERFKRAISQVRVMAGADTPIRLTMGNNKLAMRASSDYGEGETELAADYSGEELTVAFNPKYLLDGIDACPGDELVIYALDELKPAVLRGNPENDFLYLLMPVRVSD